MTLISDNIKYLRKKIGLTQEQFAERIGIKRSLVGAYEEGRADPRITNLINMADVFGTSVDILINKNVMKLSEAELNTSNYKRGKEVLAITVDSDSKENIELVPQKAAAGYLNGYADREFIEELPKFKLPILPENATYRAFEISGDSMLPILSSEAVDGGTRCRISTDESVSTRQQSISGIKKMFSLSSYGNRSQSPYGPTMSTPKFFQ